MSIQYKKSDILSVANVAALFSLKVSDNHLVQTQGYSTEGIGANLYRYDASSTATIDGGFVLPGPGGTLSFSGTTFNGDAGDGGRFIAVDQTVADVTKFGAIGDDGATDDTAAIKLAFAAKNKIYFPPKVFLITSSIDVTSIDNVVVTGFGATLKESSGALASMLSFVLCNNLKISGLHFESNEDYAYFQANSPTERRSHIYLQQCLHADVSNVSGEGKRNFILNYLSDHTKISNFSFVGFLADVSGGALSNTNSCPAVYLRGGSYNVVTAGSVNNHGSAVLVELTSQHLSISGITGEELHDNGVYVSSGANCTVSNCSFRNSLGDGVKLRGTNLIVQGCSGYNLTTVVHVSGINPADSSGAGGWGTVVSGNTSYNCSRCVYVSMAYNLYMRNVVVTGNTAINSTLTGAVAPIEIISNIGNVNCVGNSIQGTPSDMGISITHPGVLTSPGWSADASANTLSKTSHEWYNGTQVTLTTTGTLPSGLALATKYFIVNAGANTIQLAASYGDAPIDLLDIGSGTTTLNTISDNAKLIICSNNHVSGVTGSASTAYGGIKLYKCDDISVCGNVFDNLDCGIGVKLVECNGGVVAANVYSDGYVARFPSGDNVSDVIISGNYGNGIYVGDTCVIGVNFILANGITGFPATSTTPSVLGQLTYAAGDAYIATGVSASGDWKKITP